MIILPYSDKRKQVTNHPNLSYSHFLTEFSISFFQTKFWVETLILPRDVLKPQDSFGEFHNFFLNLQKVQEIIRKHHQTFMQLFWMTYCKSGNIRGTLIFADFAQNSASANSKTRKNICDILYEQFGHVGVVYWPCVLMQMGNYTG